MDGDAFVLGYVPGATPAKWARVWRQRHHGDLTLIQVPADQAHAAVVAGDLDAALLRPPVDRDLLHAIVLYTEEPVLIVSRDHLLAALGEDEQVAAHDLADDVLLQPVDDVLAWAGRPGAAEDAIAVPGRAPVQQPETTADAVALVAAGIGVLVLPKSLARLHHRKDVVTRPFPQAPGAPVALAWSIDRADARTEDLIGIVRGRTVNSSRGAVPATGRASKPDAASAGRSGTSGKASRSGQSGTSGKSGTSRRSRRR